MLEKCGAKCAKRSQLIEFQAMEQLGFIHINNVICHLSFSLFTWIGSTNAAKLTFVPQLEITKSSTSDRRQEEELNTRVGKAGAVMQALHYSIVMKRELSKKAKLSQFSRQFLSLFSPMIMNLG